jgi:MFS transporter, UMF1 family
MSLKNIPKITNAWCMYDWANSVHSLVITSAIFPIYFNATARNASGGIEVDFFGFSVKNSALFTFATSFAFLFIALVNPILGAIADYSGQKKSFMKFFVYLGALSCLALYFFEQNTLTFGVIAFTLSMIGWSGSIVFYNAYLPEIATEDHFDALSARGFTMGYIGSVLLLIFNLTMLLKPDWYGGVSTGMACKISFLTVGLWWLGFAQIPFRLLPNHTANQVVEHIKDGSSYLWNGFRELKKVFSELRHLPLTKRFLIAFFLYNMGVQTLMYVGTMFGTSELHLKDDALIVTILILQFLAIGGAYVAANLSAKWGNIAVILVILMIWIVVCVGAYFVQTEVQFYGLAAGIGFVMGGVQSMSRSTYAKFLPENTPDTASYFSFYDACDKFSTFLGLMFTGIVTQAMSMRTSVLFLVPIFIIGFLVLRKIPSQKVYH